MNVSGQSPALSNVMHGRNFNGTLDEVVINIRAVTLNKILQPEKANKMNNSGIFYNYYLIHNEFEGKLSDT